jgi:uncharacterized protein YgiM (DUF1202 family)
MAVVMPIYSLIGGLNNQTSPPPPSPAPVAQSPISEPLPEIVEEKVATSTGIVRIIISESPLGYVNVRKEPDVKSEILFTANNGEEFDGIATSSDWFQINLIDGGSGYVSQQYAKQNIQIQ